MGVEERRKLSSCEPGDIDGDEKRTGHKASLFRFESKNRIWELARPQTDKIMVDVLESGRVTSGGSLDMLEDSQRKGKRSFGPHAIRFHDPATLWGHWNSRFLSLNTEEWDLKRIYILIAWNDEIHRVYDGGSIR